ncbi:MAG: hypothetical protein ABW321_10860 [Polyangiales bacterium]
MLTDSPARGPSATNPCANEPIGGVDTRFSGRMGDPSAVVEIHTRLASAAAVQHHAEVGALAAAGARMRGAAVVYHERTWTAAERCDDDRALRHAGRHPGRVAPLPTCVAATSERRAV